MDGTFIESLADNLREPVEVGGMTLIPQGWQRIEKPLPVVAPLEVSSLTSVVTYLQENRDKLDLSTVSLHVAGPRTVTLLDRFEGEEQRFRRKQYLAASCAAAKFEFGSFIDAETFVIALQTCFAPAVNRDELLLLISSIRENSVRDTTDDGVGQEVSTARGVVLTQRTRVPNPVLLRPYRTFREVEQPESPFVLRLRQGNGEKPQVALFEADGGLWRLAAVDAVASFLRTNAPLTVPVLA